MKNSTKRARYKPRPFPWLCHDCGEERVHPAVIQHTSKIKYNGKIYSVEVPALRVPRCESCGGLVFGNDAEEQINRAFRDQMGLLQPEEIEQGLKNRGLTQKGLAEEMKVAEATVSRWTTGAVIQSQAMDQAMRSRFASNSVCATSHGPGTRLIFDLSADSTIKALDLMEACVASLLNVVPPGDREEFVNQLVKKKQELCERFTVVAKYCVGSVQQEFSKPFGLEVVDPYKSALEDWGHVVALVSYKFGNSSRCQKENESVCLVGRADDLSQTDLCRHTKHLGGFWLEERRSASRLTSVRDGDRPVDPLARGRDEERSKGRVSGLRWPYGKLIALGGVSSADGDDNALDSTTAKHGKVSK